MPTITSVTASASALSCGDQRPLSLAASTSQPGASSFAWNLPPGWNYVPNTPTNTTTVSVDEQAGTVGAITRL
ncbi:hypothetical protein [Hymenobacter rubripertinctus]|uniref:hypothetical protein n=1 Tax=Hymenobacter rubripertinctus TaxID=2029981 RepID=UPI0011C42D6A|nr:hypothetical protein [Hymenobacter rubripertinctus]